MRRFVRGLIPAFLFLYPLVSVSQSAKVSAVEKVGNGIWTAQTAAGSTASWFLVGDEVVAVDAGGDAETGKALLAKIQETAGKPVRYLVVTHAHGDHGGGAGAFASAGAEVICHESAAPGLAPIVAQSGKTKAALLAFSERISLFGGTRRVAIYHLGAAHSASDIFVLLPDDKVLFTGDVAVGKRAPYMQSPDVNPRGWENVLARLSQLDVEKVVPGHGTLGGKETLTDTLAYVKLVNHLAEMLVAEKTNENLIEARLRRPDSGIGGAAITPEFLANIRAAMRAESQKPAPTPAAAQKKSPAGKKG
jgi:cyclase